MMFKEIARHIYHVKFSTRYDLTSTFLRFQEHYESPEFRGKYFSLAEYKKWYIKNSRHGKETGKFTYHDDWSGFNFPSKVLKPFYSGKFDPLSKQEKEILTLFKEIKGRFYVIGTYGNKRHTLKHEIAHGFYYTDDAYRNSVLDILRRIPKEDRKCINTFFSVSGGYHKSVFDDETHAYLLTNFSHFKKRKLIDNSLRWAHDELFVVYKKTKERKL